MSAFQPGDLIRCIDASGTNLVYRRLYLVVPYQIAVDTAGLVHPALVFVRRNGRAEGYFPERFWPAYPELEPFTPYRGSLDEYGPAPEKVDPIFAAIGKVFPTHRADIVRALDELRGD